jgi:hypothetical protein
MNAMGDDDSSAADSTDRTWTDPWPVRSELIATGVLTAAVLVIVSSGLTAFDFGIDGFGDAVSARERLALVADSVNSFGALLLMLGTVLLVLDDIIVGEPPIARSSPATVWLHVSEILGALIAVGSLYAAGEHALGTDVFPSTTVARQTSAMLQSLAGACLGAVAAIVADRALGDDSLRRAFQRPRAWDDPPDELEA